MLLKGAVLLCSLSVPGKLMAITKGKFFTSNKFNTRKVVWKTVDRPYFAHSGPGNTCKNHIQPYSTAVATNVSEISHVLHKIVHMYAAIIK